MFAILKNYFAKIAEKRKLRQKERKEDLWLMESGWYKYLSFWYRDGTPDVPYFKYEALRLTMYCGDK